MQLKNRQKYKNQFLVIRFNSKLFDKYNHNKHYRGEKKKLNAVHIVHSKFASL